MDRKTFLLMKDERFSYKICLRGVIFEYIVVFSAANSVGISLEFAAFGSGPDAKYRSASAFWFCLSTTMVFATV